MKPINRMPVVNTCTAQIRPPHVETNGTPLTAEAADVDKAAASLLGTAQQHRTALA